MGFYPPELTDEALTIQSGLFCTRRTLTRAPTQHPPSLTETNVSKLTTGAAYSASAGAIAHSILTWFSPEEWSAVGVLAGISIALLTCLINWYYRRKLTLADIRSKHCRCRESGR